MPETRLVQQDGKAWLAYRFLNARDHRIDGDRRVDYSGVQFDPRYLDARSMLNALFDARGDSAIQGVVDQTSGQYYATDVTLDVKRRRLSADDRELLDDIVAGFHNSLTGYGLLSFLPVGLK